MTAERRRQTEASRELANVNTARLVAARMCSDMKLATNPSALLRDIRRHLNFDVSFINESRLHFSLKDIIIWLNNKYF